MDARVADGAGHDNTRGRSAGETVARAKAELLDDAIRDMLDFTVGWCSDKLSDADKLERIRVIGERAISSKASD